MRNSSCILHKIVCKMIITFITEFEEQELKMSGEMFECKLTRLEVYEKRH